MTAAEFRKRLNQVIRTNHLDTDAVCVALNCSKPTLHRWRQGHSAPHEALREPILTELRNHLAER